MEYWQGVDHEEAEREAAAAAAALNPQPAGPRVEDLVAPLEKRVAALEDELEELRAATPEAVLAGTMQIAGLQQVVRIQQRELIEKQAAIDVLKAEKREAQGEVRP
jgi:hypothetical protein